MVRQERLIVLDKQTSEENFIVIIGFPDGSSESVKVTKEAWLRTKIGK